MTYELPSVRCYTRGNLASVHKIDAKMDHFAEFSELYSSYTNIACIFGVLLNVVLLMIVVNKTPARLQKYTPVMALICLVSIIYEVSTYALHSVG